MLTREVTKRVKIDNKGERVVRNVLSLYSSIHAKLAWHIVSLCKVIFPNSRDLEDIRVVS